MSLRAENLDRKYRGNIGGEGAESQVRIRTEDGRERGLDVGTFIQDKLEKLPAGKSVILLLDGEDKVTDLAIPPVP